jgi:hypothetical protein
MIGGKMENRIFQIDFDGNKYEVATTFRKQGGELLLFLHGIGCSKESFKDIWFRALKTWLAESPIFMAKKMSTWLHCIDLIPSKK